jgi:hypothetical protein
VCGDISEEEWEAENAKEKSKAWHSKFGLDHFAQQYQCVPLLRGVDHIDHAMCVLHVMLCIAGTIYKHAVSINVENETQAVSINGYLHGYLHVYIGKAKVMSKGEAVAVLKRPSFVGSEAPKVLEHLEMLLHLINYNASEELAKEGREAVGEAEDDDEVGVGGGIGNRRTMQAEGGGEWGPPLTQLQHKQLKAARSFMTMYNAIRKRLPNAQDRDQRREKAGIVGTLAFDFLDDYKEAFGDSACTPYVHMVASHLPKQILNIEVDIMELSGQALEHLNSVRKAEGKHTNHQLWTAADVTKAGVMKRGVMDQLMQLEYNRKEVSMQWKQRRTLWERKCEIERKHTVMKSKQVIVSLQLLEQLREEAGDKKRIKYEHVVETAAAEP